MSLNFNNVNIIVNGYYVMAESVSVNQESPQRPLYILNNLRPYDNASQGLKNSININYTIEPVNEPNYAIITGWKNNTTGNLNCTLNIGGISFPAYLNTYSFDILPNTTIKAQASYVSFTELTGAFFNQGFNDPNLYNLQNGTGQAHYWSVNFTSGGNYVDNNILQLAYNFNSNIIPSYKLGSPFPCQVSVMDATEEINVTNETQNPLSFSGQDYRLIFNNIDNIRIFPLSHVWDNNSNKMDFSISGFEIQSEKSDISIDNLVVFSHSLKKFY